MKKNITILFILLLISTGSPAQFQIGLSAQPGIIGNRVSSEVDSLQYSSDGNNFKTWVGLFVDVEMTGNYYFSTGIYWAPKNIKLRMQGTAEPEHLDMSIQYIQFPLYLKLMTDEIALDKRLYFIIGPAFDIKIEESLGDQEENLYIEKINFWDVNLHLGAGIEFKVGQNTILAGGLSYYRGMVNSVKPISDFDGKLRVKNDFYALNLAIKF